MNVYDGLIRKTAEILSGAERRELRVLPGVSWKLLDSAEFLMGKEVAFELGDRHKPGTAFNLPTGDSSLVPEDGISLIGPDLNELDGNANFSRITFLNIDDIPDPNKAYIQVKRLEYERYRMIPEGYMVLSSSFQNKENVRVSRKALKRGLNFEILGNLYIDHYRRIKGVNSCRVVFVTGDHPFLEELCALSRRVSEVTDAFDHILKNVVLDCDICPLKPICDDVEELRRLHFERAGRRD